MKNIVLSIIKLPFILFLIYFLSFFFKKKKFFKIIIIFNTFFLIIFTLPITSYFLELHLYPKKNIYEENSKKEFSLILVPTAGFKKNIDKKNLPYPSQSSINRLNNAYNFSKKKQIPIFISGGKTIDNLDSEAEILIKNFFENLKNRKIILEKKSINSYETSINIHNYINKNEISNNIILITDLYHFKRMSGVLKNKNIISFFPKELFVKEKVSYKYFIPTYENFRKINAINYAYSSIIFYLMSNRMNFEDLY